jgi:undecaprenyl-diphosphatase
MVKKLWLRRVDDRLLRVVTSRGGVVLDQVMPRASRMADHLRVWWLIAAVMAAAGDRRSRRAAVRAVLAMAVAGSISNVARTQLFDGKRPPAPVRHRRPGRVPHSAAFPSGHAAGAAAFATTLIYEASPLMAAPVTGLAGVVAYSRLYTGAHYPSDVAVGTAAGAATALVLRHLRRRRTASWGC